jgi:hypothetical protein
VVQGGVDIMKDVRFAEIGQPTARAELGQCPIRDIITARAVGRVGLKFLYMFI